MNHKDNNFTLFLCVESRTECIPPFPLDKKGLELPLRSWWGVEKLLDWRKSVVCGSGLGSDAAEGGL